MRKFCLAVILLWCQQAAFATINLELTRGIRSALPIAVIPFAGETPRITQTSLSTVMANNLLNSGQFRLVKGDLSKQPVDYEYWRKRGANHIVTGQIVMTDDNQYLVTFQLIDAVGQHRTLLKQRFDKVAVKDFRALAHHMSDLVYEQLTGDRGVFSTKIAYVNVIRQQNAPTQYILQVADADGHQAHALMRSHSPIMSPSWSPDGRHIAYVSFENTRAEIYVVDVIDGKRRRLTNYPGINGAPSWSPDGKQLAVVLSKDGAPKIYVVNVADGKLKRLTDGVSIDTEPTWHPDGQHIIFTSDRGGAPQIYQLTIADGKIQRLTYTGAYNAGANLSPDARQLIMLHRDEQGFNIAVQDMNSGRISVVTRHGSAESPSMAPNGSMVIYAGQDRGRNVLNMTSTDGQVQLRLPAAHGDVQEPAWGPFIDGYSVRKEI